MMKTAIALCMLTSASAFAHCDSLDGPVVEAGRRALAAGEVSVALAWVRHDQETAIRKAFAEAAAVRKLNADAARLAETWFFETLVRVHRAGEGAPYTGLKAAGGHVAPAIRDADAALSAGDAGALQKRLSGALEQGLRERFLRVMQQRKFEPGDVAAGRRYVAAYVEFVHFAERVEAALGAPGEGEESHHVH